MRKLLITIGEKFNRLTVLTVLKWQRVECECDCGKLMITDFKKIRSWNTKSCWCFNIESIIKRNTSHWMWGIRIHRIWNNMKNRCTNPRTINYQYYGGRWISFEPKRATFEWFLEDMSIGYEDWLSIDRIDNNWNYCKENCKWSTRIEQCNNRRNSVKNRL